MSGKFCLILLPIVLLLISFVGNLIMGARGVPYPVAKRVFSMVILQTHLALIWGALARKYRGSGIGGAIVTGLLIGLTSQILIIIGTAASYVMGTDTYFNNPEALNVKQAVSFGQAMTIRLGGLAVNCIISMIAGLIGYFLAGLLPPATATGTAETGKSGTMAA